MKIGFLVKQKRQKLGYTQTQLAIKAGISLPTVQNLEANKANPTVDILKKMCVPLGLSFEVQSLEPHWGFLHMYGLPLVVSKKEGHIPSFSYQAFAQQLFLAIDEVSLTQEERSKEALAALLLAIQKHYPTYFSYFLLDSKVQKFLNSVPKTGRLLKLTRIALEKVSKVL